MLRIVGCVLVVLFFNCVRCEAGYRFDGVLGKPESSPQEVVTCCQRVVGYFLPYNPIVVYAGACDGKNTIYFAKTWKKGQIVVFEPNPQAFKQLVDNLAPFKNVIPCNRALNVYKGSSLLHLSQEENSGSLLENFPNRAGNGAEISIPVSSVVLQDWCKEHAITHIDCLHLDVGGVELQILKSSPEISRTASVIWTKTYQTPPRVGATEFSQLNAFLEGQGFVMLSHWYEETSEGDAIFIKKNIYDAIFR